MQSSDKIYVYWGLAPFFYWSAKPKIYQVKNMQSFVSCYSNSISCALLGIIIFWATILLDLLTPPQALIFLIIPTIIYSLLFLKAEIKIIK